LACSKTLTAEQRSLRGRIGGYEKWARTTDRTTATKAAREAFNKRFEDAADPEAARHAYYLRLSFESAKVRRARKAAKQ